MSQPVAWHNGQFIPAAELMIAPQDMGFMLGVTVAEQLRTFRGALFEIEAHVARLRRSLQIVNVEGVDVDALAAVCKQVVEKNHRLLPNGSDLGVTVFITPGLYPTYCPHGRPTPNIGVHTYPLPFGLWANKYATGQQCELVSVTQVSEQCWPRELKCRSRMHYYLADQEARGKNANARAILLDGQHVNEASTANVLAYFENEGLVSPRLESILPGVSLRFVEKLAAKLDCQFTYRDITSEELVQADEILLTSTPYCILPVSQLGDQKFQSRDCFTWLMKAWNGHVGMDVIAQADRVSAG